MAMTPATPAKAIAVWGLELAPLTLSEAVDRIDHLFNVGRPTYVITANLHYAMLTEKSHRLHAVNREATMILADGMPLVWASRLLRTPLPERVAGADLIWKLCERASSRGRRIFILGGAPGVAEEAARKLRTQFPEIQIVGTACPQVSQLSSAQEKALIAQIRDSQCHLLILALGQPKGELWIADHCSSLGVPVSIQLGASIDFIAGNVQRAPQWMQSNGIEWAFRLAQEPRRLIGRYVLNLLFLIRMLFGHTRRRNTPATDETRMKHGKNPKKSKRIQR